MYPIIPYTPKLQGESYQPLEKQLIDLKKLSSKGYMRVVHHGREKGYHTKLVLNDREAVSFFVWNGKIFRGSNTLARSYGLIPIEEIEADPEEGDRPIAEGEYRLRDGYLELWFRKIYEKDLMRPGKVRYKDETRTVREAPAPPHRRQVIA